MSAPWHAHYDPGIPTTIGVYPEKTLVDFVAEHAKTDKVAAIFKGRRITFRELDRDSDALAAALVRDGLRPGDRVAVILPNCPQFLITELAVWKARAILAPVSPIYTERELTDALNASKPRLAVVLTPFYGLMKRVQPGSSVERVVATNIKEYLPGVLRVLFTLVKEKKEGHRITVERGDAEFQSLIASAGKPPAERPKPEDPAILLMSGGTTGVPKGVLSDHRSVVMSGVQLRAWLREALEGPGASIMLPLPLFHTYGCAGAQSITLQQGLPLILVPNPRDFDDVVKTITRDRPALFCGVPSLFNALLNHPAVVTGKSDFHSIRACFSGAAPLMAETKKRFEELTGGRIVEGYSLTEATMACCVNPLRGANKIGSVGMPVPDVMVKIRDSEEGVKELPAGEVGEIVFQAPQLMRGYWDRPDETAEMLRDGWLHTGDLGYLDEDGYLFIVDRKKDLIKAGGFQVWPREIEEVLTSHPAIAEAGVAGVPDADKGEVITAWVVARPGMQLDFDEVRAYCRERLAPYKVPRRFELRTELPKTMIGKVLRRVLVAEAVAARG
jgi:long-chain acyl-CoA synthetase